MPLLSSSIIQHHLATVQQVEEALARQSAYGGDLLTNLLEIAPLSEERVARALADAFGLEAASTGELPRPPEQVRRLVPADVAERFACHPLEEHGGTLVLAVSEPLPAEVESDLGFALGVNIAQRVASFVRVRQAVARDYGLALDPRIERALAKLEGRAEPGQSLAPGAEPFLSERPATIAPVPHATALHAEPPPAEASHAESPTAEAKTAEISHPEAPPEAPAAEPPHADAPPAAPPAEPPPPPEAPQEEAPKVESPVPPPVSEGPPAARQLGSLKALVRAARPEPPRDRRRGPYTAAAAERDLLAATTRDDVLSAFFDFALQYFEYAALFAVHADLAEGRDAHGPGASRAKVQSIGVPLDLPGVLASAREAQSHELVRLSSEGLDGGLAKDLERKPGRLVLLLPIQVRGRTLLILYGDHGDRDLDLYAIGDVISFAPHVASALERLIVQRKRGRGEQRALASLAPPPRPRVSLPSQEERAQALVSVLSRKQKRRASDRPSSDPPPFSEPPPERADAKPPAPAAPPESTAAEEPPAGEPEPEAAFLSEPPPVERADDAPTRTARGSRPLAPALVSDTQRESAPPRSIAEALARPVIAVGKDSDRPTDPPPPAGYVPGKRVASLPPSVVDAGWEDLAAGRAPYGQRESGTHPGVGRDIAPPALAPREDSPEVSIESGPVDDELAALDEAHTEEPARSRAASHSARPLPHRTTAHDQALPSVIVDRTADCQHLVDRLLGGDPEASEQLIAAGATGISALVAAFPGPIDMPPSRRASSGPPRASECGPILKVLARTGTAAVPFLVVRTHDADPNVRSYATRLLGELPTSDGARAIARRFFDGDLEVRRAALAAARLLTSSPDTAAALVAELGLTAEDRMKPTGVRLTAMEVLAELRHPQAVPYLVLVLEDNPVDVVQAARRSLVILARTDLGTSSVAWSEWWRENSSRHRIEWLIDALTHESRDIRRAAGEELKALTREYFGYYDDLPPADRRQAQAQYREWWESRGKARFRP
jgi:hypothetical protein